MRHRAAGAPELLVDEASRAAGHAYYRSTDHQPSPDNRYFAWAEDVIGNDRHRIVVRDTLTGATRVLVDADAYGYGGLVFSPSSRWLFWIWRDARNRPTRLYRTPVIGGAAELVYEEADPALFMAVKRTAMDGYVALTLSGPDTAEVRLIAAAAETSAPRVVWPRRAGVRYEIDEWNATLVSLTDLDDAFDGKVVAVGRDDFRVGATLMPHRPGHPILSIVPFAGGLVRLERADGLHRLVVLRPDGREHPVSFPEAAYALDLPVAQDFRADSVTIIHQSPISPPRLIAVGLVDGRLSTHREQRASGFDPGAYVVEQVAARAPDGALVPITLLSRRGAARDGTGRVLLYGYGAYGVSSDPDFSIPATVLVDRGWTYAIAHVRGGSELGRRWFLEGRRFAKRNSFTDFVACAQHLCRLGYAAPRRVVGFGLSAGGLLVGGAMNVAPTLWGGIIAKVPFVDMLNTMSDASHPLVPLFRPDWGDPLADPRAYDYLATISPYENVTRDAYPPLLCTAGLKDDRVSYWEPAKLVAQVRSRSTAGDPALLLTDLNAGHQGSADLRSDYAEKALFWAFAGRCVCSAERRSGA
nr:prolyl oligopeptidase family serine peptidase [Sphingomonas bacterium]